MRSIVACYRSPVEPAKRGCWRFSSSARRRNADIGMNVVVIQGRPGRAQELRESLPMLQGVVDGFSEFRVRFDPVFSELPSHPGV